MTNSSLHFKLNTIYFIAALASSTACTAQNTLKNDAPPASDATCLAAAQILSVHLYGTWQVELIGSLPATDKAGTPLLPTPIERASMLLQKNPDYDDSLGGWLQWSNQKVSVVGDIDDGSFSLEESDDGTRISAVWEGEIMPGSCGKAITGTRRVGDVLTPFVLRKSTGWN
jgi:hypothetical protein